MISSIARLPSSHVPGAQLAPRAPTSRALPWPSPTLAGHQGGGLLLWVPPGAGCSIQRPTLGSRGGGHGALVGLQLTLLDHWAAALASSWRPVGVGVPSPCVPLGGWHPPPRPCWATGPCQVLRCRRTPQGWGWPWAPSQQTHVLGAQGWQGRGAHAPTQGWRGGCPRGPTELPLTHALYLGRPSPDEWSEVPAQSCTNGHNGVAHHTTKARQEWWPLQLLLPPKLTGYAGCTPKK